MGADVSSAHAERSSAAPCGLLGGQSRLGKGSTAQDAIGKGMTFTRARHNPLSLVILNERRFCASEGPRRAARTGVPIMPAFGVMGWAMPRVLCEEILARSARFLIILRQSSPAETLSEVEGTREESAFLPLLSMYPPATQKSATTLSPFMGEITIGSTCRPHPRSKCHASR